MKGRNIAVVGLGRSGLAIATAALELGARPVVFDQTTEEKLSKRELVDEARARGIELVLGYSPSSHWFSLPDFEPDLVVTNPAVPKWHAGLAEAVSRGTEVISEIEFAYRISKAPIVAITGTNGKSTTTVMTYLCLQACGIDAVLCGNIFGSGYPEIPLTEAALHATSDQVLVAEVSSFQLEWINRFRPRAAAITNISPDHLDRYDSFEAYAATKTRIYDFQGDGDFAVFGSLEALRLHGRGVANPLVVGRDARVVADSIELLGKQLPKAQLRFAEEHNYLNAAMAALLSFGILASRKVGEVECIFEGLRQFSGLAHRMERLGSKNGIELINNSMCTNPAAVVNSARNLPPTVHILLGGTNKRLDFEPLRQFLSDSGNTAYIFGSDAADLSKMLAGNFKTCRTMEEAFKAATEQAKPGDTIMLAPGCASTDQFRDFRHRGDVFKAVAMEWLNQ
ncbi:MAG: UDP-N-acetylmuramoyl-L-alanine--D-glutamate ligase [Fimbriimonas sp.]